MNRLLLGWTVCLLFVACGGSVSATAPAGDAGARDRTSTLDGEAEDNGLGLGFPLGSYPDCTLAGVTHGGGAITAPGTVTLARRGGTLVVTYADYGEDTAQFDASNVSATLAFTATAATSGTLAGTEQSLPDVPLGCSGDESMGTIDLSFGTLTYDANTVYLSLAGELKAADGWCQPGSATMALSCSRP